MFDSINKLHKTKSNGLVQMFCCMGVSNNTASLARLRLGFDEAQIIP